MDLILGENRKNPTEEEAQVLKEKTSFRVITWICVPLQVGTIIWSLYTVSIADFVPIEWIGFILSVGIMSGVMGINVSHELQHRVNGRLEVILSRIMLFTSLYAHWAIEHVVNHHRYVATQEDPATAKKGQNVYSFWLQSVFGGIKQAWNFEKKRSNDNILKNRVFWYYFLQLLILICIFLVFGWISALFFVVQAIIAFTLLEIINYIEHYGLLRDKKADGKYENIQVWHSWNSNRRLTNWFLFNLQRHSDHHWKPGRRYQLLRYYDQSPQLPTGYAGMVLIAMIPTLYRKIVHPRLRYTASI